MGTCLSDDLRIRVVSEVEKGSSRRAAAARFGVSVSSAIRWTRAFHQTGSAEAKPQGGDRRSKRIEAHRAFILKTVAQRKDRKSIPRPTRLGGSRRKRHPEPGRLLGRDVRP